MVEKLRNRSGAAEAAGVIVLLLILSLQLFLSVRRESQTWDEGNHIYAGYMSWKTADFGLNPEHPPLAKLLATVPLLPMSLNIPESQNREFFKKEAYLGGKYFLYRNDADAILIRTRMAAAILTIICALLVFAGTREMFGKWAAFVALTLLAFDPNLLAHGALVTTDAGLSCFLFATIYAFYRYVKAPSWGRLSLVGLSLGFALAIKHSAIFIIPMLLILAICEILRLRLTTKKDADAARNLRNPELRFIGSFVVIAIISLTVLWSFYGFRYQARPEGLSLNPSLADYSRAINPKEAWLINTTASLHLLPESYLFGMTDILLTTYPGYVLGKSYPQSVWFYFPLVFFIKSTLAFLALFLLTLLAIATRRLIYWREILFLSVPPILYFLVAIYAGTNIGVRHILPIYIFLSALAGGTAWALTSWSRKWGYAIVGLLLFHVVSSALTFPHYIPYSNELWGGSGKTYKWLSDSNVDWGEQLKETKTYLDMRGVKDCWFVYFAEGVVETDYYGIPCKPLPTANTPGLSQGIEVPPSLDGTVLISASNLSGFEYGPNSLNPYEQFKHINPTAVIGRGVFVFDGHFDLPLASALSRVQNARNFFEAGQPELAVSEAEAAVALAPESLAARIMLGDLLRMIGREEDARLQYDKALQLAKTIEPEFQERSIPEIEEKLSLVNSNASKLE